MRPLQTTADRGQTVRAVVKDAAFLAGNSHVLAVTLGGALVLLQASSEGFSPVARLQVFENTEVWSHPALVGNRLYLRSLKEICCLLLGGS